MFPRFCKSATAGVMFACLVVSANSFAQGGGNFSGVDQNSNAVGTTPPGFYRGIPAMQDNEPSCAINPLLTRNIVCAWNASGGSDDPAGPGDTWIRMSESLDAGKTFVNRYLGGSNLHPPTSLGQQFAADPTTLCWPGGCGTVFIASTRAEGGGIGGGIYLQLMMDMNIETGFRHYSKTTVDQAFRTTGDRFADKPHAIYIIDEDNPGTVEVTMEIDVGGGATELVTREWPRGRIIVSFALFNSSKNDIEIMSTYTDNYGGDWSPAKQVAVTSGQDTGISISAIGDTVAYAFRRFANGTDADSMMMAISTNRGRTIGKPFAVVPDLCPFDQDTLPNLINPDAAASRTNDFPWLSNNGEKFLLVYSERRRNPADNGCLTSLLVPSDSRIKAMVGSIDGQTWSAPVEIAPNPDHGFQFMPATDCSLGICQVIWWDTRRDSQRVIDFLQPRPDTNSQAALLAFLLNPLFADFNFEFGDEVIQFRRTADILTTKVEISSGVPVSTDNPPELVSRYRLGLLGGELTELEFNPFHVKSYRDESVPFMSDYVSLTSAKQRLVLDLADPTSPPTWEDNSSFDPTNPDKDPVFWAAYTDARNVRGQIYTARVGDAVPYTRTPETAPFAAADPARPGPASKPGSLSAEPVEDFNPGATVCTPFPDPGAGELFVAINNRTKDFDIFGATIENQLSAWSLNTTKTLGNIQRTYAIVGENASDEFVTLRFEIANQPSGFDSVPRVARASWDQLPFDLGDPLFQTVPPDEVEFEILGPQSSISVTLFLVSQDAINPVTVNIYDDATNELVDSITVNGAVEAGRLIDSDFNDLDIEELHDPSVFPPVVTNPDLFNPDLFNPDLFNPDLFNPDLFNPDLFNPDLFNPDLFNPDLFNPDLFNPDLFNPDLFNATLADADSLDNPEIPNPDLTGIQRNPDGTVAKIDMTFGVGNEGNTTTAYVADFAVAAADIRALIADGELTAQLLAWQHEPIADAQLCEPRIINGNRIIAAVSQPDLFNLAIPDITDNRLGSITFYIAPEDLGFLTIRWLGSTQAINQLAQRIPDEIISYVITSQAANTGEVQLNINQEQILVQPAEFNFQTGDSFTFEATIPGGTTLPLDFVTATQGADPVPVSCAPALGSDLPLDILNSPPGPTPLSCTADTPDGDDKVLNMLVSVVDTAPPTFDAQPPNLVAEAAGPAGTAVDYALPTATDALGVDPDVSVSCTPAQGSVFPLIAPGPTTTVDCLAQDDSGNEATTSFTITVQDTSAPVITGLEPEPNFSETKPFVLDPDKNSFRLLWGPIDVQDADAAPNVSCSVGELDLSQPLYTFVYAFPAGTTQVTCTATDNEGLSASGTFPVTVFDETAPVITLNGDNPLTIKADGEPYVDAGATAVDNADPSITVETDSTDVDTNTPGTYTVVFTATDNSGNTATVTRTVIVELVYAGATGIEPRKLDVNMGSSNPLFWAWLDHNGNALDTSGDMQMLSIRNCDTGDIVLQAAGDPGSSDFRFKSDNYWQFNWETTVAPGDYCAAVMSSLTGQQQFSPPITVR